MGSDNPAIYGKKSGEGCMPSIFSPTLASLYAARETPEEVRSGLADWRDAPSDTSDAYLLLTKLLKKHRLEDAAEDTVHAARVLFPDEIWPLRELGWKAMRSKVEAGLEVGAELRRLDATHPDGYIFEINACRVASHFERGAAVVARACEQFGVAPWLMRHAARLFDKQGDWSEALRWSELCLKVYPGDKTGYVVGSHALRNVGRLKEALDLIRMAATRFGDPDWISVEVGLIVRDERDGGAEAG